LGFGEQYVTERVHAKTVTYCFPKTPKPHLLKIFDYKESNELKIEIKNIKTKCKVHLLLNQQEREHRMALTLKK